MKSLLALIASAVAVLAPAPDRPSIIHCTTLEAEVYHDFGSGRRADSPMDEFAFCPTEAQWREMSVWVRARSHVGQWDYINEAWDCEDMAREWVHWTHRWAVENFTKGDPFPIATYMISAVILDGFMGWELDEPGFHAMGLIRMSNDVWWIYDPATDQRVKLVQAVYGEGNVIIKKISW